MLILVIILLSILNFRFYVKLTKSKFLLDSRGMEMSHFFVFGIWIILIIFGDIELNLRFKKSKSRNNFYLCHWNVSSIIAHDFSSYLYLSPMFNLCTTYFQHMYNICTTNIQHMYNIIMSLWNMLWFFFFRWLSQIKVNWF